MSNVEIYDSSNSQLSSDEYSHDEDDDALMDVAVSKQTPAKSNKSNTTSTDTTPSKSSSTETTPRKLSLTDPEASSSNKAPDSQERTRRQIKQMQRNSKAHLYFKRRSIKWLNQRLNNKPNYLSQLKEMLPRYREQAKRMAEYHARRRAAELEHNSEQQRRYERTPSRSRTRTRSRSRSRSVSPELICLDDTENEDSPEKPTPEKATPSQPALIQQQQQVVSKTPPTPPFIMQLEQLEAEPMPAENGSVLDEFLTLKPAVAVAAAAPVQEVVELKPAEQLDLTVLSSYSKEVAAIEPTVDLEMPLQEGILKRRRSVTPPAAEPNIDKRTKTTEELDDDIIEFIPSDMTMAAKQTPQPQPPPQPQSQPLPLMQQELQQQQQQLPLPPPTPTAKPPQQQPTIVETALMLKLGSPFSLTPTTGMEFYNEKQSAKELQAEQLAAVSYSLETPTPTVEAMEIVYPTEKLPNIQRTTAIAATEAANTLAVNQQQLVMEPAAFAAAPTQQLPQQLPQQQQQQQHQQQPQVPQQELLQLPQQQQQQTETMSQQQFLQLPQQQLLPRPKRSESTSRQTQTQPATRSKSSTDLNNSSSNPDATFHQRVKEMYMELDEIMTDKVRAVKPELKSFADEKQRIDSDIKTLDKLISQKEEEHNRLLHLRCVKGELRARIERKERMLIMSEILPTILNKNCNTSEIYEMHTLLMQEQNAAMPSRYNRSAMEQLITRVENGLDDIKMLRSALGMQEKELPTLPHYESQLHRRNSMPLMRPPPPPAATVAADRRSANYGRQGAVRDVRGLIEDYRREHPEELPLMGKRNKQQPQSSFSNNPSRYQQLINESKQLTNSSMQLAATSSETQRNQPQLLNNHFDNETPLKPLYNSSPLGAAKQHNESRANSHYNNEMHSVSYSDQLHHNRSKHIAGVTTNGAEELERRCQQCQRFKATYMCAGCKNQWYCSKECQLHAWDTHWETCAA